MFLYMSFVEHIYSFLLSICPRGELLGHRIYICSALVDTSLHSHERCVRVLIVLYPCQHSVFSVFSIQLFWLVCNGITLVLFYIILMTDEVEHLFMYLLAVWISSFMKFLFRSFAHFSTVLSVFFLLSQFFIDFSYFTDCSYFHICEYHLLLEAFLFSMISNLAIHKYVT